MGQALFFVSDAREDLVVLGKLWVGYLEPSRFATKAGTVDCLHAQRGQRGKVGEIDGHLLWARFLYIRYLLLTTSNEIQYFRTRPLVVLL